MPGATQIINGSASGSGAGALMGSSVLGMIGSMVMNGINNDFQRNQNEENRRFALQQQQRQNEFNLNMWNRQNAYNSPSSQVQRLLAAGLNPNLAYGSLGNAPAQQLTSADAKYNGQASRFNDPFGDMPRNIQTALSEQRAEEMHEKQMYGLDLQNKHQELMNTSQDIDNQIKKYDLDDYGEFVQNRKEQREVLLANMKKTGQQMDKTLQLMDDQHAINLVNKGLLDEQLDFEKRAKDDKLKAIQLQNKLTEAQTRQANNAANLLFLQGIEQQYRNKIAQMDMLDRQEAVKKGYNQYIDAHNKVVAEIDKIKKDTKAVELANEYQQMVNSDKSLDMAFRGRGKDGQVTQGLAYYIDSSLNWLTQSVGNVFGGFKL